jgi:predicted RNase H-like HicB family nuclease
VAFGISCWDRAKVKHMTFTVEFEREDDGRWLAEVVELAGVLADGETSDEAIAKAQALAFRTLADRKSLDEEREDWARLSLEILAEAYRDDEPEYSLELIKEANS